MAHLDVIARVRPHLATLLLATGAAAIASHAARCEEPRGGDRGDRGDRGDGSELRASAPQRTAIRVACDRQGDCESAEAEAVDVWSEHRGGGLPLDVVVLPDGMQRLVEAGVAFEVLVDDIDAVAREEYERLHGAGAAGVVIDAAAQPAQWFSEYRDYRAITERMIELARLAPDVASMHAIGSSVEGRTIWALRIRGRAPDGKRTRMLIDGTLHAREWIAAMTTTCIADRAVRDRESDPAIRRFLENTELWVVPVANPDGYQYSWAGNRYWRKNRRGSHGVDLNRNFAVAWGGAGSSGSRRSEIYRGEYAFSEPETAALRDLVKREGFALHLDYHSYGQMLLFPWTHTDTPTKDNARFMAIGERMATTMKAAHDFKYKLMPAVDLYPSSGTATDWMYGEAQALSYTIELRPSTGRGLRGFVLPPEQIRPTCDEGLAAAMTLRAAYR